MPLRGPWLSLLDRPVTRHTLPRRLLCAGGMHGLIYIILVGLVAGWASGQDHERRGLRRAHRYSARHRRAPSSAAGCMRVLGFYTSGGLIPSILVAILGAVLWWSSCAR